MARKSQAALSVVTPLSVVNRLSPPPSLTDEEAEVWAMVVDARPADFFGADSAPVLEEYCKAVVMCRFLGFQIEAAKSSSGDEKADMRTFETLLRLRDMESKRVLSSGTKLRLTNQSRYTPDSSKNRRPNPSPQGLPWQRKSD